MTNKQVLLKCARMVSTLPERIEDQVQLRCSELNQRQVRSIERAFRALEEASSQLHEAAEDDEI